MVFSFSPFLCITLQTITAESQQDSSEETLSFLDVIGNAFSSVVPSANAPVAVEEVPIQKVAVQDTDEDEEEEQAATVQSGAIEQRVVSLDAPVSGSTTTLEEEGDEEDEETLDYEDDEEFEDEEEEFEEEEQTQAVDENAPVLIVNPDAIVSETLSANTAESLYADAQEETMEVHAAETLAKEDLKLGDLLSLLGTLKTKSAETLDTDDNQTFEQVQALLEAYQKTQQAA